MLRVIEQKNTNSKHKKHKWTVCGKFIWEKSKF